LASWHDDCKLLRLPNIELDCFGVEDYADMNRLQGSEYYVVWIEEPAPYYDEGSVGIREDVFNICYGRGAREDGVQDKIFVTMNPASKRHWTYKKFILQPAEDMEIIRIPYGENPHLGEARRRRTLESCRNNPEFMKRYVEGEFASVHLGEEVLPEFSEGLHVSHNPLAPFDALTFRFWDGGLNPTCVFVQVTPNGQIRILDTVRGENIGMKQLVDGYVKPLMMMKYFRVPQWRDIGDLHLRDKDQSDSTKSAAEVIERELNTYFEDGEMSWEKRRETLKEGFNMMVDGEPRILISSNDAIMIEALGGGWHYNKNPAGVVLNDKPVKDIHSHPGDALSHGLAMLLHPGGIGQRNRPEKCESFYDPFAEETRSTFDMMNRQSAKAYNDFDPMEY
jgi:hypothetical protein